MRTYCAVLKCGFSSLFRYRSAVIAGVATQFFWGAIKMMILIALYTQTDAPQPITLAQAITFIWLAQATITLLPWDIDIEVEEMVRTGNVVCALTHPIDLYWLFFARSSALRILPTLGRIPIIIGIAWLCFGLSSPVSLGAGVAFAVSLLFSSFLASAITAVVMTSLFWTLSGEGIKRILPHFTLLLSGAIVPLPLFPEWLQPILSIQPMRGIIDIPCRIYTGVIPLNEAAYYLAFQVAWIMLIVMSGRLLMAMALRKIEIQGG